MQAKLNEGKLLNAFGNLSESGFSTTLVKDYDRRDVKISKLKVKESDMYYFGNSRYGVCIKVADYSTYGYGSVSVIDYEKNTYISKTIIKPLTNGKMALPKSSKTGGLMFHHKNMLLKISNDGVIRRISCKLDKFDGVADFECEVDLQLTNRESLVTVIPFKNKKHFRYSQMIPSFKVRGSARVGGRKYSFYEIDSFGILKWERSVLPYKENMVTAVMSGIKNGKQIAFNFMSNIGSNLNLNENMIFYDNKSYKVDYVDIKIPTNEKGKQLLMDEWELTSNNGSVKLKFTPTINCKQKNGIVLLSHVNNYVYGYFSGTIVVNEREIFIDNLIGYIDVSKIRG